MQLDKKKDFNDEDEDNIIDWSQVVVKPKEILLNNENSKEAEKQDKVVKYPL